jgi:hypothetical protein
VQDDGPCDLPGRTNWSRRDWLAAGFLFLATAGFVLWQNSRIAVLWDLSYLLDTSWRIAVGQVPYRDFPLVHPPLTFLIQAAIMRLAGRVYLLQIAYVAVVGGLSTVVAWRIILRIMLGTVPYSELAQSQGERTRSAWAISLLLAAPLSVLGIHSIYPHPIYDCDCVAAILVALFLLQRIGDERRGGALHGWLWPGLTGAAVVLPVFFKQNIGLPFLLAVVAGIGLLLTVSLWSKRRASYKGLLIVEADAELLRLLAAIGLALVAAVVLIEVTAGLGNYLHWTVRFAAQRRLPGFGELLHDLGGEVSQDYRQELVWTVPALGLGLALLCSRYAERAWLRVLAACLAAAPFLASIVFLCLNDNGEDRADNLLALWPLLCLAAAVVAFAGLRKGLSVARLLPFCVLAAILGTLLSQRFWGSTYAIWPLLMVLVAYILASLPAGARGVRLTLAAAISATFLLCGGLYAASHERLNYIYLPDEPVQRATLPALRGMADRGPYLADFEELVRFADREIPAQDGILLLPGEEPFYFATGRVPRFPVQIFDRTTDPYSPEELMRETERRNIRWVIVKARLQSNEDPLPERARTMELIQNEFREFRKLEGYEVYRRP